MSQANADVVRAVADAWSRTAFDEAAAALDPAAEWHNTSSFPGPTVCSGRDEIVDLWRSLFDDFAVGRTEIEDIRVSGDAVVVLIHNWGRGRVSGAPIDTRWGSVWHLRDGRIVRVDVFGDYGNALAAAGLADSEGAR